MDERHGAATLQRLLEDGAPTLQLKSRARELDYAAAFPLEGLNGTGVAVALDRRPTWVCARGLCSHPGGIHSPEFGAEQHDAVILIDSAGVPERAASTGTSGQNSR